MKSRLIKMAWGMILLLLTVCLFGCHRVIGQRFYPGNPRPLNEVALFTKHEDCLIPGVVEEGKPTKEFWENPGGELLPGRYILRVGYIVGSTVGHAVNIELNAQPGHLYYVYPELFINGTWVNHLTFSRSTMWRPVMVDIARDEDFYKVPEEQREKLQNWRRNYLQGERPAIKQNLQGYWDPR
jgi:hypothetical protein